ncbi:uncharacterized protein PG986_007091 [Apiospora aurea]|uniref:Uncharacterized protein n=1 Tax=Apiospora aurea TaxID=335848 RepID=A0ABR1QBY7_9PEZI
MNPVCGRVNGMFCQKEATASGFRSGEAKNTGTVKPLPQTSAGLAKLAIAFTKTGARPPDKKPDEDEDEDEDDDAADDGCGTRNSNEQFI